MSKNSRKKPRRQAGAAPYRIRENGHVEVMLVTTRETGRWVTPKGWLVKKLGPAGSAMLEAYEEAGVRGECGPAIGSYQYMKVQRSGPDELCEVEVFPLLVSEELADWPEMAERERRWFPPAAAADLVVEADLRTILADFPGRVLVAGKAT